MSFPSSPRTQLLRRPLASSCPLPRTLAALAPRRPRRAHLLCLEAMLQLESQLVWLVLHQACGPEAGSGLHAECGVAGPLSHGMEVRILHGVIASLGHLGLRCILLWENRGLLLQHDVGFLTGELFRIDCLALKRQPQMTNK